MKNEFNISELKYKSGDIVLLTYLEYYLLREII